LGSILLLKNRTADRSMPRGGKRFLPRLLEKGVTHNKKEGRSQKFRVSCRGKPGPGGAKVVKVKGEAQSGQGGRGSKRGGPLVPAICLVPGEHQRGVPASDKSVQELRRKRKRRCSGGYCRSIGDGVEERILSLTAMV